MKRCWKQQKKAEKSVNLRANFDKNKKASRIKALQEFTMKRLTDFFGEKDWKTAEIRYNENRKRSKYCCWTVPMRDWNSLLAFQSYHTEIWLNRTYERLKPSAFVFLKKYYLVLNRTYEWLKHCSFSHKTTSYILLNNNVEPYPWVIETHKYEC